MNFIKSLAVGLIVLTLFGCSNSDSINGTEIPTQRMHGSFDINMSDKCARVGSADYVFIAYVNKVTGTVYKNPVTKETEEGNVVIGDPYTNYTVTVLENIKGSLKKNTEIPLQQAGGLSSDGSSYILYENDELLTPGNHYIIIAYAQPDGSLLASGPYSNTLIEIDRNSKEIMSVNIYNEYKNAFKNEIKSDRKRFKSIYED